MRSVMHAIGLSLCILHPLQAQGGPPPVELQTKVGERFRLLHDQIQELEQLKVESSPDESRLLAAGNRLIQEQELHRRMAGVRSLMAESRWDEALQELGAVHEQLLLLLDLLLDRARDLSELMEGIEQLEDFGKRIDAVLEDQREQKDRSAEAAELERAQQGFAAAMAELERLVAEQGEVSTSLENPPAGATATQRQLRERGEQLAEQVRQLEQLARPDEEATEESASRTLGRASAAMSSVEDALSRGEAGPARAGSDEAVRELEAARAAMQALGEQISERLEQLPLGSQADAQAATREETEQLAEDMRNAAEPQEEGQSPAPVPGSENVEAAVPNQQAAAQSLQAGAAGAASQQQQDAIERLEQAQQAMAEAMEQLRNEMQDEVLRAMEERFTEMLTRQQELSKRTRAADRLAQDRLTEDDALPRAVKNRCEQIAAGERELAGEAEEALRLLTDEGSTAVFPALTEMLRDDLLTVADRLEAFRSGPSTQALQADIEKLLEDLIESLGQQLEQNESQESSQSSESEASLVPMSAEFKLLLTLQKRVNGRTLELDERVPAADRGSDEARVEAADIAGKQKQVREMTRELASKLQAKESK